MGLCQGTQNGRLILNSEKFAGKHRLITIPANGEYSNHMKYGRFEETDPGKYLVVFANCNDEGRSVIVEGRVSVSHSNSATPANTSTKLVRRGQP